MITFASFIKEEKSGIQQYLDEEEYNDNLEFNTDATAHPNL